MRSTPALLFALAAAAGAPLHRPTEPARTVTSDRLGGESRCIAHVSTDKPVYREGETVLVRAAVLHARTRRPSQGTVAARCEVVGPKGETVHEARAAVEDGVAACAWAVPAGQPGGQYEVRVSGADMAPGRRSFDVRAFRAPRIKSQIVFLRDGFGPGDEVIADVSATRAEGGAPHGAALTIVAMLDGAEIVRQAAGTLDSQGRARVGFRLPRRIDRGDGTLAIVIADGGVVETASKTLPILVRAVDIALHPEGGDLVAGVPARLYFEARTPVGKPADVAGTIEAPDGTVVARFRSEHEGRGRVRLVPEAGVAYVMRVTEPAGVTAVVPLPPVVIHGAVVSSFDDVTPATRPLRLRVGATESGTYELVVARREEEIARQSVRVLRGDLRPVRVPLPEDVDGVLRVTLFHPDGHPLAERLVFRQPADGVRVEVTLDRPRHVPGDEVVLLVRTTRLDGMPVPATVGLTVGDDSVRELLETRDQPPALPVQVLLEPHVLELADAAVYLDPADGRAPRALDLLLGTQGWRRFAFVTDPETFVRAHGDEARRVLGVPGLAVVGDDDREDGGEARFPALVGALLEQLGPRSASRAADVAMEKDMVAAALPPAPAAQIADEPAEPWMEAKRQAARDERLANEVVASGRKALQELAFPVRVYAHRVRPGRRPGDRVDFTDTVYWNAGLRTDARGEARVSFALSDAVTSFRVLADAFTDQGLVGAGSGLLESVEPFYVEPKLPLEITMGDVVALPVTAVNGTLERLAGARLDVQASGPVTVGSLAPLDLGPGGRVRRILRVAAGSLPGDAELRIDATAGSYHDAVTRRLRVAPLGFPVSQSLAGLVSPGARVSHDFVIPDDVVAGSIRTSAQLFPTPLGNLTSALERLIQEPYGCFEQTSSTTYPLVMAQQYFTSHAGVDPALVARSQETLGRGYERLTSFECDTRGYEWFGESPGHEALTAFGLLELTDMSRVRPVDADMLARTRQWLLATRDGRGGFKRERRALHQWIEDADCSNGYVLWALLETGEPAGGLVPEIDAFLRAARRSENAYVQALAANVAQLASRSDEASALLARLAERQDGSGRVAGATASIVGSTGEALDIETTALAALAWQRSPGHVGEVARAMRFLAEACEGGRYGSTQSTVLALRAIVAHGAARSVSRESGRLVVRVDGREIGPAIEVDATVHEAVQLPDFGAALRAGTHRLEIEMEGGTEMPWAVEIRMSRLAPESSPECPLDVKTGLSTATFTEGDAGEVVLELSSRSAEPLPMAVAIVGLPGGLEPRHEQLEELVRRGEVSAVEVIGREVVLYFRSIEAHASKRIALSVVAAVPGTYAGPASRAYLYYSDEHRAWAPGLRADIAAR